MNRAERRKAEKKGLTAREIKEIEQRAMRLAINESVTAILAAVLIHLRDKHGWGGQRGMRLLEDVNGTFEAYQSKHVTLDDLRSSVAEEMGILLQEGIK